jgi:hypothetical protein
VFTPGGVLHTNNYLQGTWKTLLSDGPIKEAKLERAGGQFRFTMKETVSKLSIFKAWMKHRPI